MDAEIEMELRTYRLKNQIIFVDGAVLVLCCFLVCWFPSYIIFPSSLQARTAKEEKLAKLASVRLLYNNNFC